MTAGWHTFASANMPSPFGAPFLQSSRRPLVEASARLVEGHLVDGLEALSRSRLEAGYGEGIKATTRVWRVKRVLVVQALPSDDVAAVLTRLEQDRLTARRSVGQFVGALGAVAPPGASDLPASRHLKSVADKYALDAHIAGPLSALSTSVAAWEKLIEDGAQHLSSSPALRAAVWRRRIALVSVAAVVALILACSGALGVWHHVVVSGAQERIGVAVAASDPCAAEGVDEEDLRHARPDQIEALDRLRADCAERREREAHLARCGTLAARVKAGTLGDEDRATAGEAYGLLQRVASVELAPKDLTVGGDVMPCRDTPAEADLWQAFVDSAAESAELWGRVETLSPHVKTLLTTDGPRLSEKSRDTLRFRVEGVTKRAIKKGLEPDLERARRLCGLVDDLGYPQDSWCKALARIDAKR